LECFPDTTKHIDVFTTFTLLYQCRITNNQSLLRWYIGIGTCICVNGMATLWDFVN